MHSSPGLLYVAIKQFQQYPQSYSTRTAMGLYHFTPARDLPFPPCLQIWTIYPGFDLLCVCECTAIPSNSSLPWNELFHSASESPHIPVVLLLVFFGLACGLDKEEFVCFTNHHVLLSQSLNFRPGDISPPSLNECLVEHFVDIRLREA